MILIFLGPPGAGKGTQAKILEQESGFRQISTGDLLRANRRAGTELGVRATSYMDRGDLVPDELIIAMMEPELTRSGDVILDGFPRTVAQARALDEALRRRNRFARAVVFDVDRNVLIDRLTGRWTHLPSGRVYHERFAPPKEPGRDDVTGEPLVQREDDTLETIRKRLDVYDAQTAPLIAYYGSPNRITRVDALGSIDDVTAQIRRHASDAPSETRPVANRTAPA